MAPRNALDVARDGYNAWAAKPHNAKWVRKIDGTPIPNDLPVCIANEFMNLVVTLTTEAAHLRAEIAALKQATPQPSPDGAASVTDAARAFVAKVKAIHDAPEYQSVWTVAHLHRGPYKGPKYEAELAALEAALLPAPQNASPTQVSGEAAPLGGSTTAYSREQLAKLAYVVFYSPVLCAPQNIAAVVKEVDCCPGCDHVTNGGSCRVSGRGDYCPNDLAETLRQISVALYGPGEPSHYVALVFGPDKVTALSAQDAPSASLAGYVSLPAPQPGWEWMLAPISESWPEYGGDEPASPEQRRSEVKLTETTNAVPNPGSDEALQRGCKCARIDNGYGKGYLGRPGVFVYTEGCPLHWRVLPNPSDTKGGA